MVEKWKDIAGYEGYYQVSNIGRVRSLDRVVVKSNGVKLTLKGQILSAKSDYHGYLRVNLSKSGKVKLKKVHRLVAEAFLPNPDNLPEINHKNEIKTDNRVDNLEWCSHLYNTNYGTRNHRLALQKAKPVIQLTLEGEFVNIFESIRDAERKLHINNTSIVKVLNGERKTAGGYIWKYKD